ncbi:MAG TPA: isoprenylcysteine carboxylmethyltransferase family protein [Nevskiaceae bacterium]|nr:isoprenylcysteine carboxylmethyltransferase family protein [Nevskiaceae bacterium]
MSPRDAIIALWALWVVSWIAAAAWGSRTDKRPGIGTEIRYRIPMLIGALFMFVPAHGYEGALRVWHIGWMGAWISVGCLATGIVFAWWARIHLGRLWSGSITRKTDHRVVDSGPYALVRHPIYTGLLFSLLATTAAKGTWLAIAGFALLLLGIWMKARFEEQWLGQELDAGAYASYRQRVPMLLPFGPRGG